jgi:hypothetical protein
MFEVPPGGGRARRGGRGVHAPPSAPTTAVPGRPGRRNAHRCGGRRTAPRPRTVNGPVSRTVQKLVRRVATQSVRPERPAGRQAAVDLRVDAHPDAAGVDLDVGGIRVDARVPADHPTSARVDRDVGHMRGERPGPATRQFSAHCPWRQSSRNIPRSGGRGLDAVDGAGRPAACASFPDAEGLRPLRHVSTCRVAPGHSRTPPCR